MRIINTGALAKPGNWLVVWAVALLFFYTSHLLLSFLSGVHPGQIPTSNTEGSGGPGTDVPDQSNASPA